MKKFKSQFSFEDRIKTFEKLIQKFPDRIPVICEPSNNPNIDISHYEKTKYLVPQNITIGEFLLTIRNQLKLNSEEAIFLFINNTLPSITKSMGEIYNKFKDADGFLYLIFSGENTFGFINLI